MTIIRLTRTARRQIGFGFLLAGCFFGGACGKKQASRLSHTNQHKEALLMGLNSNLYKGAPFPPEVTNREYAGVENLLKNSANDQEIQLLKKIYNNDLELIALARRDSDADGIFDYRIDDSSLGDFYEGDIDIDGDGVRNVQDLDPFDSGVGTIDRNRNSIGDHIDWRLTRSQEPEGGRLADIQEQLFKTYNILLVERSAKFPLEQAIIVSDALRIGLGRSGPFHSLRVIATDAHPGVIDDGGATNAMIMAPSQWMLIFESSFKMNPFIQLALLVHELTHNAQYDLDWDTDRLENNYRQSYFSKKNFNRLIADFRWKPRSIDVYGWKQRRLFASLEENHRQYLFRNKTTQWWQKWLDTIWHREGETYLQSPKVKSKHIVGEYSLVNPLEWHADQFTATILMAVLSHAKKTLSKVNRKDVLEDWFDSIQRKAWPGFRAQNILESGSYVAILKQLELTSGRLDYLAETYTPLEAVQ